MPYIYFEDACLVCSVSASRFSGILFEFVDRPRCSSAFHFAHVLFLNNVNFRALKLSSMKIDYASKVMTITELIENFFSIRIT